MTRLTVSLVAFLSVLGLAQADTVTLKDGTVVEWRIMKDLGDSLELETRDNRTLTIQKKDVKSVSVEPRKAPLTGATFTDDTTKGGQPVNLLPTIDPKKHGAGGEISIKPGMLLLGGTGMVEIPYTPSGQYDLEIILERRDGDDEFHLGAVAAGHPFSLQIDWSKGQCTGLSAVDGRRVFENDTRTNGRLFERRKPRSIVMAVREGEVVVLLDGKEYIRWKGEAKRLSLPTRPEKNQNLFLQWNQSSWTVMKLCLVPRA